MAHFIPYYYMYLFCCRRFSITHFLSPFAHLFYSAIFNLSVICLVFCLNFFIFLSPSFSFCLCLSLSFSLTFSFLFFSFFLPFFISRFECFFLLNFLFPSLPFFSFLPLSYLSLFPSLSLSFFLIPFSLPFN